jgi:hypothetical protein
MASVAQAPPVRPIVRHGTARLELTISGVRYSLRRSRPDLLKGARVWTLRRLDPPREGAMYCVVRFRGVNSCSCPDADIRKTECKHVRALVACGLVSGRKGVARG